MARTILGGYRSYHFKDHDPIIDYVDRLYELSGVKEGNKVQFSTIADASGVTEGTLRNWRSRKTKRPQNASLQAVIRGLGGKLVIIYKGKTINGSGR